jgi:4-diphosphocytidyl-2-C-methyl-D-erythritol kinase
MPIFRSFAKLNLHLEVEASRTDGFHQLRTIFQTIDLADELEVELTHESGEVLLEAPGSDLPTDGRNLAVRAAELYLAAWRPESGARIVLRKGIPAGGGLGGGSANAATVLVALDRLAGGCADCSWMESAAQGLGADVPFFLTGGTAIGTGRGDLIRPLADPPGGALEIWLALPPYGIPTAAVFGAYRRTGGAPHAPWETFARLAAGGAAPGLAALIGGNDLETAAFALRPELGALYTELVRSGARKVRMSGSGSTLFALFDDAAAARRAAVALPPGIVWKRVQTLGRDAWRAASGFDPREGGV